MSKRKMTARQIDVMIVATKAYPQWFRARTNGERVTLASLWRMGFLERRVWRDREGEADAAHEYRPTSAFIAAAQKAGVPVWAATDSAETAQGTKAASTPQKGRNVSNRQSESYQPMPGDLVVLRWDPTTTRIARFVRYNGAGNPVVQVERVGADGARVMGEFGAARCFGRGDVLGPAPMSPAAPQQSLSSPAAEFPGEAARTRRARR